MTPRLGQPPDPDRRYVLRPGVYAILPRHDALLLTHQAIPWPEVQLPGGGIDPGEQPLAALHREVYEETGWRIGRPRRLGAFRRFTYMPEYDLWAEKLCIIYSALPVRPLGVPSEPGHHALWMSARQAAEELGNPGDRAFVRRHAL
ncbi:NUDIX domain-containing protein [Pseudoponticoccus marisrubri]|uniref:NUDIX hydrolase n=1 Tax=Pseudoponticoccus marisrubri TaxID=1685382 RepID=A0A0W7WGD4_9RHOB|nr:NUDIX hydrolase [Pseudoponticoccus marisrubri]KUF09556.1 NUDIX hydrolase [Pseudoponticoccus marisrubri]